MEYRVARSLLVLRDVVNTKWPKRRKDSDGTIGDANHASRSSDHNPWVADPPGPNVVTAMDITNDIAVGCNSDLLAQALLASRDIRIKYIISSRRIVSGPNGPKPWEWRGYTGTNPHIHHCHISVREVKTLYDSPKWWEFEMPIPPPDLIRPATPKPTQRQGMKGPLVKEVQEEVGVHPDGIFGPKTHQAVMEYQKEHGLFADGIVGPMTWRVMDFI